MSPSRTKSRIPPTSEDTTGSPIAHASITATGVLSIRFVLRNTSPAAPSRCLPAVSRKPLNRTACSTPNRATSARTLASRPLSCPPITNVAPGTIDRTRASTRTAIEGL